MARRGAPKGSGLKKTPEIVEAVIEGIGHGQTLRSLCRAHNIGASTWYDWMEADGELAGRFARAREQGFDAIADETLEIVDDKEEDPASRRVRADVRLKLLAKWDPRRYGDAVQLKHADADGDKLDVGPTALAIRAASLLKTALDRDDGSEQS